jgi:hypothetical protein
MTRRASLKSPRRGKAGGYIVNLGPGSEIGKSLRRGRLSGERKHTQAAISMEIDSLQKRARGKMEIGSIKK